MYYCTILLNMQLRALFSRNFILCKRGCWQISRRSTSQTSCTYHWKINKKWLHRRTWYKRKGGKPLGASSSSVIAVSLNGSVQWSALIRGNLPRACKSVWCQNNKKRLGKMMHTDFALDLRQVTHRPSAAVPMAASTASSATRKTLHTEGYMVALPIFSGYFTALKIIYDDCCGADA